MSETSPANGAATDAQAAGPTFSLDKLYVKDVSFEAPGSPQVFVAEMQAQPQLQMNLAQSVQRLGEAVFEVQLDITVTCVAEDKTLYLAEVKQAGLFTLAGFDPQTLDAVLGTLCPSTLFPYARQVIGDMVQAGGFPPFLLQPLNFESLYAESLRQRAAQQQAVGDLGSGTETAGNA
jgi:preprotein translocase subunit SecB